MKVLLTIGYTDILLPDESGVQQILKVLGKGRMVSERYLHHNRLTTEPGILKVSVMAVPPTVKIVEKTTGGEPE